MISVRLTPLGRLREIAVVDPHVNWQMDAGSGLLAGVPGPPIPPPNWDKLFEDAGLTFDLFRGHEVSPERIPPVYAKERFAWEGVYPESKDTRVRVEAATLGVPEMTAESPLVQALRHLAHLLATK